MEQNKTAIEGSGDETDQGATGKRISDVASMKLQKYAVIASATTFSSSF